jgi:hypothetical protein
MATTTHSRKSGTDHTQDYALKHVNTPGRTPADFRIPVPLARIISLGPIAKVMKKVYYTIGANKRIDVTLPKVDLQHSKAFMLTKSSMGVFLTDKTVQKKVIKILNSARGIAWAKEKEDVYWGPWVDRAPDVMVCPKFDEGYTLGSSEVGYGRIVRRHVSDHHPEGIAIFVGDRVNPQRIACNAVDITPTVLAYFGLPLPIDMDGSPVTGINYPKFPEKKFDYLTEWKKTLKVSETRSKLKKPEQVEKVFTSEEEKTIRERLRSLGYI